MSTSVADLEALKSLVLTDMVDMEELLCTQLERETYQSIRAINVYLANTPGKRLRPLLVCLSYRLFANTPSSIERQKMLQISVAIELIHMASLVHDDIIDHAPIRHNQPSIVAKWGMETAIPMGVYLYAQSLLNISKAGHLGILQTISHAVKNLCVGELHQVLERNQHLSVPHYLMILKKKTGVLFAAAAQAGAMLAGASKTQQQALKHYGNSLGLSFQILDDYMDIVGHEEELKKQPGQDLTLGEFTLPVLYWLETLSTKDQTQVLEKFKTDPHYFEEVRDLLNEEKKSLKKTTELAQFYLDRAQSCLSSLPVSRYLEGLQSIPKYVKSRIH